jgi:hypothetical protein
MPEPELNECQIDRYLRNMNLNLPEVIGVTIIIGNVKG